MQKQCQATKLLRALKLYSYVISCSCICPVDGTKTFETQSLTNVIEADAQQTVKRKVL